jgi:hypothetical protein
VPPRNGHTDQNDTALHGSEERAHGTFWATSGWTPEGGYPDSGDETPRIPAHLKGKGRARVQEANEGGTVPEEQDSSECGLPQPDSLADVFVPLTS